MKPTPRQLVVLMSIAGLGLSLGKPAYGRIEADVSASSVAVDAFDLRSDGPFNPLVSSPIDALPAWRTLVGELGDNERAAMRVAIDALRRDSLSALSDPSRQGSRAVARPRVSDQEYERADALALVLMEDPRVPAGAPAHPQPPATRQLVTGLRQRDPKGSSTSMQLRPWTSVAGPDPQPEGQADEARPVRPPLDPTASAVPTLSDGSDSVAQKEGDVRPSHAWLSVAELARYLAGPPLDDATALATTTSGSERAAADSQVAASAEVPVGVDIDLPLDLPQAIALSARSTPVAKAASQSIRAAKMDRMAEALRQVLVAEIAPRQEDGPVLPTSRIAAATPAPTSVAANPIESRVERPIASPIASPVEPPIAATGTTSALDINLAIGPMAALDVNPVVAESALDIELDIGLDLIAPLLQLDLNLDLRPPIDIELAGSSKQASGDHVDIDVDLFSAAPASTVASAPTNAVASAATNAIAGVAVNAAGGAAATTVSGAAVPNPATAEVALPAESPVVAVDRIPRIVVAASHGERVRHSLEALLSPDDAVPALVGTQAGAIFVSSHAERALLTLAATLGRHDLVGSSTGAGGEGGVAAPPVEPTRLSSGNVQRPLASTDAPRSRGHSPIGEGLVAVGDLDLDRVRGGFDAGNGLQVSFGIERAVYINGSLVTTTSLNVSDAAGAVRGQSPVGTVASAVASGSGLTLIQNGAGNTFLTGPISAATLGTVVQNTLNDQKIQNITSINAAVNSLQVLRAQNFESTLRGALIDSLRR